MMWLEYAPRLLRCLNTWPQASATVTDSAPLKLFAKVNPCSLQWLLIKYVVTSVSDMIYCHSLGYL